jgi:hypothetical protein
MRAASLAVSLSAWAVLAGAAGEARAEVIKGDAVVITTTAIAILGGITTSVAATVYALDGRAFDSGWVIASLLSSSFCAAFSGALIVNSVKSGLDAGSGIGAVVITAIAAWPAYWTIKGALEDVDPGERFEQPETSASVAAIDGLPRGVLFTLPALRF